NENFSAIIHYVPLGRPLCPLTPRAAGWRVLDDGKRCRSSDRLPNWRALLNFRFWPKPPVDYPELNGRCRAKRKFGACLRISPDWRDAVDQRIQVKMQGGCSAKTPSRHIHSLAGWRTAPDSPSDRVMGISSA